MTPLVGPVFRGAQKGIRSLMPKRGPRTLEPAQIDPAEATRPFEQMKNNLEMTQALITLLQTYLNIDEMIFNKLQRVHGNS
jgi:hypothetical protein